MHSFSGWLIVFGENYFFLLFINYYHLKISLALIGKLKLRKKLQTIHKKTHKPDE